MGILFSWIKAFDDLAPANYPAPLPLFPASLNFILSHAKLITCFVLLPHVYPYMLCPPDEPWFAFQDSAHILWRFSWPLQSELIVPLTPCKTFIIALAALCHHYLFTRLPPLFKKDLFIYLRERESRSRGRSRGRGRILKQTPNWARSPGSVPGS